MKRREFLKTTVAAAGVLLIAPGCAADDSEKTLDGSLFFPQSVASGDPHADSVILWTRAYDEARADQDLLLDLQIALDPDFSNLVSFEGEDRLQESAQAAHDHCAKIRVTGLLAGTTYHYRFLYTVAGKTYASPTGRTRTAPAADADAALRFAFMSCQDYNGKYYNAYARLAQEEIDFFVHLGDYVYETNGNPQFQDATLDRRVAFSKPEDAIVFNAGKDSEYYAAQSLDNYRDLYKSYRSDPDLQRVHEQAAMIAVWDDHEYSNDCHGATATYKNGREDELNIARRKVANQAWYEYMPVDYMGDPDFQYDPSAEYLDDIKIYRDFIFGKNLHLVMTDLRSYRSPHLVDPAALPGALILDQGELEAMVGDLPDAAKAYIDIDEYADGAYAQALLDNAAALDHHPGWIHGNIRVDFINQELARLAEMPVDTGLDPIEADDIMARGLAYSDLGKTSSFSDLGALNLAVKDSFQLYAAKRYAESNGESEAGMGKEQEAWFLDTMKNSDRRWKVWGNEYCLVPLNVDLTVATHLPENFQNIFTLIVEDWNGQPNRRAKLVTELSELENVVAITGDIHAFFAGTPFADEESRDKKIVEFAGGSISSTPLEGQLVRTAESNPALREAGAVQLAYVAEQFLLDKFTKPNRHLAHADMKHNGFALVDLNASRMEVAFHAIKGSELKARITDDALVEKFSTTRFKVESGAPELYKDVDGAWKRWDPEALAWSDAVG